MLTVIKSWLRLAQISCHLPRAVIFCDRYYVHSLAWLKYHLNNRSQSALAEAALMKCQTSIFEAIKLAPRNVVYQKAADQLFNYAAEFTWQDAELQQKSTRLRQQYQTLRPAGNSPEKK